MARMSERDDDRSERGFRYQRRSSEAVKQRANMKGGNFDSIIKPKYKVFKVKDGKNLIRVLPPTWDNAEHYGYDLWVNYGIGVDNQSYLSLSKMKSEKDPIAEARREAERDGDKALVKALQPRQRILMWVIDRNEEDEGPQLFAAPFTVDKALAALSFDEDTKEVIYIDDPKEGCDVRFYKEGTGLKTDYPPEKMRILKPGPLHPDKGQANEWLEFVQDNPLPECLQFYDYDHIATTFDGSARVERDEDEEKPRSRAKGNGRNDDEEDTKPSRSRAAIDDEDDDGGRQKTGRRAARSDDVDEDDAQPRRRAKDVAGKDEDDTEAQPRRSRSRIDDDEDEPQKRSARAHISDDDDEVKPRGSIRDRLSRSRSKDEGDD